MRKICLKKVEEGGTIRSQPGFTGKMDLEKEAHDEQSSGLSLPTYVPPRVEVVITTAQLEREAQYAGEGGYATF